MVVSPKTDGDPYNHEGITEYVLTDGSGDTKKSLHLNLKDAGIQTWSDTVGACMICSFVVWNGVASR